MQHGLELLLAMLLSHPESELGLLKTHAILDELIRSIATKVRQAMGVRKRFPQRTLTRGIASEENTVLKASHLGSTIIVAVGPLLQSRDVDICIDYIHKSDSGLEQLYGSDIFARNSGPWTEIDLGGQVSPNGTMLAAASIFVLPPGPPSGPSTPTTPVTPPPVLSTTSMLFRFVQAQRVLAVTSATTRLRFFFFTEVVHVSSDD